MGDAASGRPRSAELAAFGGESAVPRAMRNVTWPVVTDADRQAVLAVLEGPGMVSNVDGATAVSELEQRWAQFCGAQACIATSNGTTALAVMLAALGIGPGDEVIVPSLSFIATALAVVHQMAVPVFADIDEHTFTLDPESVSAQVTPHTAAVIAVHLHGHPADMDALRALTARHGLALVEDAAQAHGALWRGRRTGSLAAAAAFSLQVTKNLPTCGEGGLVTFADADVAERARMIRQFGEVINPGQSRDYISYMLGWNHKMSPVQAAFTLSQLDRFAEYEQARQRNVPPFLDRLAALPGITVPRPPPGGTHSWHILRLRFDPRAAGLEPGHAAAYRRALHRLLRAEGVPVSRYQVCPLPEQKVFRDRTGFGAGYPWSAAGGEPPARDTAAKTVLDDSLTIQKRHLHPAAAPLLDRYADGFEKVFDHLPVVARMALAS